MYSWIELVKNSAIYAYQRKTLSKICEHNNNGGITQRVEDKFYFPTVNFATDPLGYLAVSVVLEFIYLREYFQTNICMAVCR